MITNLRAGCQRFFLLFIASAMVLLLAIAAAIKYIGWWAGLIVLVLTVLIVRWLVKRAITRLAMNLAMAPFTMKSRVLRGADIEIHKIEKVPAPAKRGPGGFVDPDASRVRAETVYTPPGALPPGQDVISPRDASAPETPPRQVHQPESIPSAPSANPSREYFRIDATITPRDPASLISHWEPSEIVLVPYASRTDFQSVKKIEGIYPELVEVFQDGRWRTDPSHVSGPARVRYTFPLGLANREKRWKLRYFFEALGNIRFD